MGVFYNLELAPLNEEPSLSVHINSKSLIWTGHVQRMPDRQATKKIEHPGDERPLGSLDRWVNFSFSLILIILL